MITITKVQALDAANYNHIHCPQCNGKIGWKPKGEKVHIFRLSKAPGGKMETLGLTCKQCKSHYLITTDSE